METLIVISAIYSVAAFVANAIWFLNRLDSRGPGRYENRTPDQQRDNIRHARMLGASFFFAPIMFPFVAMRIWTEQLDKAAKNLEDNN